MIPRSLPKPATNPFWPSCLLVVLGLAVSAPAPAQTPAVSPVLALSGSRIPDGVILGPDGALYGASAASSGNTGGLIFRSATDGSSVATVYQFGSSDGLAPAGALLLGSDGLLYGTAQFSNGGVTVGGGTVFRVATDGTGFTKLHEFAPSTTQQREFQPDQHRWQQPVRCADRGQRRISLRRHPVRWSRRSRHRVQGRQGWLGLRCPACV